MDFACYRHGREAVTERHVQAIWYDRELRPPSLVTRGGEKVTVLHPGDWNLGAGPDFRNAVLEVGPDRRRLAGDVEIHLHPSDWDLHGHGGDSRYANVIAHVTWGCGPPPTSLPAGAVSIWLGRFMTARTDFSPEQIDVTAYPFSRLPLEERPCADLLRHDPEKESALLSAAGCWRMNVKKRLFLRKLSRAPNRRQLYYESFMEALGYRRNRRSFLAVARAVPLDAVLAERENAEAAFLAAAEFFPWDRTGIRPWNSPERRLKAAAAIFTGTSAIELSDFSDFSTSGCRFAVKELVYGGFLGRGRASAIIANILVPFAMAEGRLQDVPEWLPPEDICEPVRLTAYRLFGRDHNPRAHYARNGLQIQGLLQIYRDFCLQIHPDCNDCGLVRSM